MPLKNIRNTFRRFALSCLTLVLSGVISTAYADETRWTRVLSEDGHQIGYGSATTRQAGNGSQRVDSFSLYIREQGSGRKLSNSVTTYNRDAGGMVVSINRKLNPGRAQTNTTVTILNGMAELVKETPYGVKTQSISLPDNVRFDFGEALISDWDFELNPQLEFHNFSIAAAAVERVIIEKSPNGLTFLRKSYNGDALRGISELTLGDDGKIHTVIQPLYGTFLKSERTDKETALKKIRAYSVITNSLKKSPFRISANALKGHIRYEFSFKNDLQFDLPESAEQMVTRTQSGLILDICEVCGPDISPRDNDIEKAKDATLWIQSDDPVFKRLVRTTSGKDISDHEKMQRLGRIARRKLTEVDFIGHYSALEAVSRGSGDCSEDALVLAALGRAAGIPTRVVNGLVYSRQHYHGVSNVFLPHTWTQAYIDGHWRSYDISLGDFDASHIMISVGNGDPRSMSAGSQLASVLNWENMAQIKAKPKPDNIKD